RVPLKTGAPLTTFLFTVTISPSPIRSLMRSSLKASIGTTTLAWCGELTGRRDAAALPEPARFVRIQGEDTHCDRDRKKHIVEPDISLRVESGESLNHPEHSGSNEGASGSATLRWPPHREPM